MLEEFFSNTIINNQNEILLFLKLNRNNLIKLLCNIKQIYIYFSSIREVLDNIIKKIEEVNIALYNIRINSTIEQMNECINCLRKIFELFIIIFQYETNNSFLELFLGSFSKLLKKLEKLSEISSNLISKYFSQHLI